MDCVMSLGLDRYIGSSIYITDTDTDILVLANWISVSAISVSASVSTNIDIGYIGIGKKKMDIGQNWHISAKIPL
jgi:hypothetical protein